MKNKAISIYQDLPSGGARRVYEDNSLFLEKLHPTKTYSDKYESKGIFNYLYTALIKMRMDHKKLSEEIDKTSECLIAHHSWITKSPYLLRYARVPKIYFCHEPPREFYESHIIRNQGLKGLLVNILRLPIKYIDLANLKKAKSLTVISNSRFSKSRIRDIYGIDSLVVYPSYPKDLESLSLPRNKRNQVLTVGAINRLKRFDFLVEAVSKVDESIRPVLTIVGNGYDRRYLNLLKRKSDSHGVNTRILTNVSREKLIEEYINSLLFLYAPINEPFGIVVLEAMAAGLPVICYEKGGGYSEVVSNKTGEVLGDLNAKSWAREISKYITDENIRKSVSKENIKYVKKFSSEKMNNNIYSIVKDVINE